MISEFSVLMFFSLLLPRSRIDRAKLISNVAQVSLLIVQYTFVLFSIDRNWNLKKHLDNS